MTKGNRTSRLQGFADPPSVPNWREIALGRVITRQKKSKRKAERDSGVLAVYDLDFRPLLDEACHRRGISMAGYARRAIAAMIAYDLELPLSEVTKHMPYPTEYRLFGGTGRHMKTADDGQGYGNWHIEGVGRDNSDGSTSGV